MVYGNYLIFVYGMFYQYENLSESNKNTSFSFFLIVHE